MGLYKEADHYLKGLAKRERQIYSDACDIGIKVRDHEDPLCKELAGNLKDDFLFGGLKQHREHYQGEVINEVCIVIHLPWEQVREGNRCTTWKIRYVSDNQRKVKYISVYPHNTVQKDEDIWEKDELIVHDGSEEFNPDYA